MTVLPVVLPQGLGGDKTTCGVCEEPSQSRWCSWEHTAGGILIEEAMRLVSKHGNTSRLEEKRQTRRGPIYKYAREIGLLDGLASGDIPIDVGFKAIVGSKPRKLSVTKDSLRRAVNERKAELTLQFALDDWEMSEESQAMLGPSDDAMRGLAAVDMSAFEDQLEVMVDAFVSFRDAFMETPRGGEYITKPFHRGWIRKILKTIYLGRRHQILSPPRAGKTDLAIHFCVWLIVRNPNIHILCVGASQTMAEKAVDMMRTLLEGNEALRMAFLPPGVTWRPPTQGGGSLWSRSEFGPSVRRRADGYAYRCSDCGQLHIGSGDKVNRHVPGAGTR